MPEKVRLLMLLQTFLLKEGALKWVARARLSHIRGPTLVGVLYQVNHIFQSSSCFSNFNLCFAAYSILLTGKCFCVLDLPVCIFPCKTFVILVVLVQTQLHPLAVSLYRSGQERQKKECKLYIAKQKKEDSIQCILLVTPPGFKPGTF